MVTYAVFALAALILLKTLWWAVHLIVAGFWPVALLACGFVAGAAVGNPFDALDPNTNSATPQASAPRQRNTEIARRSLSAPGAWAEHDMLGALTAEFHSLDVRGVANEAGSFAADLWIGVTRASDRWSDSRAASARRDQDLIRSF